MGSSKNAPKRERRYDSPEQKVAIVKQHLVDSRQVSELCDEHNIQPTLFYPW